MSDDDLHGRQLLLLLTFFVSTAGLLLLIAWLSRPNWLWDGPLAAFAAAGIACYPARFLAERFGWWKRLAEPSAWTKARRERARRRAEARARANGGRLKPSRWATSLAVLRIAFFGLLALGVLAIMPVAISAGRHDEQIAKAGPAEPATVLSVREDKWSKSDEPIVEVASPRDGTAVELSGADQLDPLPEVGDRIPVVMDPDDPSNILAADADWTMHWYAYVLIIVLCLLGAGLLLMFAAG
ncbi:hypothetical protein ACQPXM_00960 [Kribbella sp. CA-253562]|uniref:hypothetical protein n=1 Tax=Kribbella sp. CA-253562 TaxID=3239942 RepID=UPI003D8F1F2A